MNLFKKFSAKINIFNTALNNSQSSDIKFDDLYASQSLNILLRDCEYIPFTQMSLRPFCLSFIMNDVVINKRKSIIEFGSGISTIIIARLIKKNAVVAKLISVESDLQWIDYLKTILVNEGTIQFVEFIHARLTPLPGNDTEWYDKAAIDIGIQYIQEFDLVIIDGPPAYNPILSMSRYPALPYIISKLATNCGIFLDDCDRIGERKILNLWKNEFDLEFIIYSRSLGVAFRGDSFVSIPSRYVNCNKV